MRLVSLALALLAAHSTAGQDRPPPIATVRLVTPTTLPGGEPVTVTVLGVVTRALGRQVFVQDSTAAIAVFSPSGAALFNAVASGSVGTGDSLQVTGRLVEFQPTAGQPGTGRLEIDQVVADGFFVRARNVPLPAPQRVTLAEVIAGDPDTETYESEIVRIDSLTVDAGGAAAFVASTNHAVRQTVAGVETLANLRVGPAGDTGLAGQPIPTGPVDFVGPMGVFRGVNQLLPIQTSDLVPSGGTAAEPSAEASVLDVGITPNPAGGRGASVRVRLAAAGLARVAVYDVLGREVVVVLDGEVPAGEQSVRLDTSSWPAGVYVVRAVASGRIATARLVVARR